MSLRTIISIHNNTVLVLLFFAGLGFLQGCPKKVEPEPAPKVYELPDMDTGDLPEAE